MFNHPLHTVSESEIVDEEAVEELQEDVDLQVGEAGVGQAALRQWHFGSSSSMGYANTSSIIFK